MTGALIGFYRSLSRHRLFAALNIGGLALGIAAFLVLFLYVRSETQVDRRLPGWDKVWILQERYTLPGYPHLWNPNTMGAELEQLHGDYPDLVGARFNNTGAIVRRGDTATYEMFAVADSGFFDLFHIPVLAGDPRRTLQRPDGLVLSRKMALKYFGTQNALGRVLPITIGSTTWPFRVGAVLADIPEGETSFPAEMYGHLDPARDGADNWSHWGSTHLATFLRFPDQAAADDFSRRLLPAFLNRHAYASGNIKRGTYEQSLRSIGDMHLFTPGDRAVVQTLGIVGLLTLAIAVVNYVNLATARASLRAREVAVRKVLGGTRSALLVQFMGEAVATVAIAGLIGLALAECALPLINTAGGTSLTIRYWGADSILAPLALLVLVIGAAAGVYPALVLARFRPAAVLASARAPGGGRAGGRLRQALVVVQFAVAIAFAIGTSIMITQAAHLRAADLGFRAEGVLVVDSFFDGAIDQAQRQAVLAAFARLRGAVAVTAGQNMPAGQYVTNTESYLRRDRRGPPVSVLTIPTSPGYFDVYAAHLLAGRWFDGAHGLDDRARSDPAKPAPQGRSVILNASAARALGFATPEEATGQTIVIEGGRAQTVIGVIADMRFRSTREPARPTAYSYDSATRYSAPIAAIRYAGVRDAAFTEAAEVAWRHTVPGVPFHALTAPAELDIAFYRDDARRTRLFFLGAALAGVIGCIGLYGLAAFDTARRVKEIGIRKTLGASTRDVLRLLLAKFLVPVLLANLLAWPIAFVAMQRWLSGFDDRIALSPVFFLLASLVALAIATVTVIGQSWRVARAEPARALRYE